MRLFGIRIPKLAFLAIIISIYILLYKYLTLPGEEEDHIKSLGGDGDKILVLQKDQKPLNVHESPTIKRRKKPPICLVSTWDRGDLPDWSDVFLESIATNAPYVKSYIFVHNVKSISPIPSPSKNVRIISLSQIDPSYRQRGFAGLITDMLCQHFNLPKTSEICRTLEERLHTYKPSETIPLSPITQLRGLWPIIFSRWVNPDVCGAWGWSDLSMMMGDLEKWLDHPMAMLKSDVVTIGDSSSLWQAYLRSPFTIFSYSKHPNLITSLWKGCEAYSSIERLIIIFAIPLESSLVEGCFSFGVFTNPSIRISLLPLSTPIDQPPILAMLYSKMLAICTSRWLTSELCRQRIRKIVKKGYDELESSGSNTILLTDPRAIYTNPPSRSTKLTILPPNTNCSIPTTIPVNYHICISKSRKSLPKMDWEKRSYGIIFKYYINTRPSENELQSDNYTTYNESNINNGIEKVSPDILTDLVVEFRTYPIPAGMHNPDSNEHLGELLLFPFHKWVEGGITVEKTWWFKSGPGNKGYVQLAKGRGKKGHAFFHSYGGLWG